MHDSLDLTELRQQAQVASELQKSISKRSRYISWISLATIVFSVIILAAHSAPLSVIVILIVISITMIGVLVVLFLLPLVSRVIRTYRQSGRDSDRIKAYAPSFVGRRSSRIDRRYLILILLIIPFALEIARPEFKSLTFLVYGLLLVLPMLYPSFLSWVYRGGMVRIDQFLRLMPNNYYLLSQKAALLGQEGQLDASLNSLRRLLASGNYRTAWGASLLLNELGVGLVVQEKYEEALPILEAAIRISPSMNYAYDSLAGWYIEQHLDAERALELSDMAIEYGGVADPVEQATNARALVLTGRTTRAQVMLEKAVASLENASPDTAAEINRQLGYAYLALGQQETARQDFQNALDLAPNDPFRQLAQRGLDLIQPVSPQKEQNQT